MKKLSLKVPAELQARLTAIALQKDMSLEACAVEALTEYAESWEDFSRTIDALDHGKEERTVLRAVNE